MIIEISSSGLKQTDTDTQMALKFRIRLDRWPE